MILAVPHLGGTPVLLGRIACKDAAYNPSRCRTNGSRVWRPDLDALERQRFARWLCTPTHALWRAGWGDLRVCRRSREPVRQPRRRARHLVWRRMADLPLSLEAPCQSLHTHPHPSIAPVPSDQGATNDLHPTPHLPNRCPGRARLPPPHASRSAHPS